MKTILPAAAIAFLFSPLLNGQERNADLVGRADQLYAFRTDTAGAPEALLLYEKAAAEDPFNADAKWKAARACHWIADHASNKREKILTFEKGIDFAKEAVRLAPQNVDGHFWLAGLWGSYGETKGVLKSLSLVGPIRKELETINRLNDAYQGGAGYRVLGIVDYKVPGFAGGSKKRAKDQLLKALEKGPDNAFNHYYLAEFYWTALKDKQKALEALDRLAGSKSTADVDAPDLLSIQKKGARLKSQIGT